MKNIHVLPTDKPSSIFYSGNNQEPLLSKEPVSFRAFERSPQHIHITSDDFIEEDDFGLNISTKEIVKYDGVKGLNSYYKKIILTTDQDLIKDGIQEIPDEFLEWFVKNRSCEYVETERFYSMSQSTYSGIEYEIIIPKEEPTFENSIDNTMNIMSIANSMFGKKEETKQETLEEFIQRQLSLGKYQDQESAIRHSIELGVKWQKEQAKEMEEQQKDDYAVEFAEWYMRKYTGLSYFKISDNELEQFKNK